MLFWEGSFSPNPLGSPASPSSQAVLLLTPVQPHKHKSLRESEGKHLVTSDSHGLSGLSRLPNAWHNKNSRKPRQGCCTDTATLPTPPRGCCCSLHPPVQIPLLSPPHWQLNMHFPNVPPCTRDTQQNSPRFDQICSGTAPSAGFTSPNLY